MTLVYLPNVKRLVLAVDEKMMLTKKITAENSDRIGTNKGARK